MLDGDVWRTNAAAANAGAALLAAAAPDRLVYPVEANEVFLRMSPAEAAKLRALGFDFYDWAPGEVRLEIGRAHVLTPVTNAHLVCRLLLDKKKTTETRTATKKP